MRLFRRTAVSFALFLSVVASSDLHAAEASKSPAEIVQLALERSPRLAVLRHEASAAQARAGAAGLWDDPQLSMGRSRKDSPEGRGQVWELSLSQRLPIWGQKATERQAQTFKASMATWQEKIVALDIEHGVWLDLYRLASLSNLKQHSDERRRRLGDIRKHLAGRPFASPSQLVDKSLVELRLRDLESEFSKIELEEASLRKGLERLTGISLAQAPTMNWIERPAPPSATIDVSAVSSSPLVLRQESAAAAAEKELSVMGKERLPEPTLGIGGSDESQGSREKTRGVSLGIGLPIAAWTGWRVSAARESLAAERAGVDAEKLDSVLVLERAALRAREAARRIELYPLTLAADLDAQLEKAEESLHKSLVGVLPFLELEDRAHEHIRSSYQAQTDYLEALSDYQRLSGKPFAAQEPSR